MRSERQALADIARAVEHADRTGMFPYVTTGRLRAILSDVQSEPEPAGVFLSPTEAEAVVRWYTGDLRDMETSEELALVRRLEDAGIAAASVPEPATAGGTIDRYALVDIIEQAFFEDGVALTSAHLAADRILELLRPVEGVVVLSRDEAATAYDVVQAFRGVQAGRLCDAGFSLRVETLAERLEAAS